MKHDSSWCKQIVLQTSATCIPAFWNLCISYVHTSQSRYISHSLNFRFCSHINHTNQSWWSRWTSYCRTKTYSISGIKYCCTVQFLLQCNQVCQVTFTLQQFTVYARNNFPVMLLLCSTLFVASYFYFPSFFKTMAPLNSTRLHRTLL